MMLKNILIFISSVLLVSCATKEYVTECGEGEVVIIKRGLFYPNYTLVEPADYVFHSIYIPNDKLEDYVYNHDEYKGRKLYNNHEKIIRIIKFFDESHKKKRTYKGKVFKGKGWCVKRDDLIFIDQVSDITDVG